MSKAIGIGGCILPGQDTKSLATWYEAHFGVTDFWNQEAGKTVFAPFRQASDYFPADRQWMINSRMDDLDALLADLSAAGIFETRDEWDTPESGRFARIHGPEGHPIELWEPPAG